LKALLDADKNLLNDFVQYAAKQGVKPVPREIARSRKIMESQLRAYIGRNTVLEDNGFYSNIIPIDNVFLKSLELLEQPNEDVNKQN
jgi:carboxyl-terminal processing protease